MAACAVAGHDRRAECVLPRKGGVSRPVCRDVGECIPETEPLVPEEIVDDFSRCPRGHKQSHQVEIKSPRELPEERQVGRRPRAALDPR